MSPSFRSSSSARRNYRGDFAKTGQVRYAIENRIIFSEYAAVRLLLYRWSRAGSLGGGIWCGFEGGTVVINYYTRARCIRINGNYDVFASWTDYNKS